RTNFYRFPALQPQMLWLDVIDPNPPYDLNATPVAKGVQLTWKEGTPAPDGEKAYGYVVYRFDKGQVINIENPEHILHITFDASETSYTDIAVSANKTYVYVITAIDRLKNESTNSIPAEVTVKF